jgi:tetratricopeptide (TPR) repeat protein
MPGQIVKRLMAATVLPVTAAVLFASAWQPADAEPVPRSGTAAGAVIARKIGEEVRFIDVSDWRSVDLKQDLLTGDILRTNEAGQLAIVFSDRTQVRLGRNTSMVVKQITDQTNSDTVLQLQSGTIWARAERGGPGVQVQTAAAAAAIRGTDWTMTVSGNDTSLTVLEGVVQLANPQGSVEVKEGEGAAATLGQAPRKVVIVDSDDREQMLFYLPPRQAFERMPPAAAPFAQIRLNADRILSTPPEKRTTKDLVELAEAQLSLEGPSRAVETLYALDGRSVSSNERDRVILIKAIIAANQARYSEAAALFAEVDKRLDPRRRAIALWGGYYARSLADPKRVEQLPPTAGGPEAAFLRAYAIGFLKDLSASIDALRDAERQYPADPSLPAYRGWIALLLNDRSQAKEAIERSLALDPHEPTALEARSHFKAGFEGDNEGALADLYQVLKVTPGSSSAWNAIGDIHSSRGANREAEAALKKAIELDPMGPVSHVNLAIFYLDTNRVEDAKREIDLAIAADPTLDQVLIARGRYHLQTGEPDKAVEDLLAGTVTNPADAQGQIVLGAAYYQQGDRLAAEQAIDNADRLDDNDPVISALRASVAIDEYDASAAILHAREYVRRARARGGEYTSLGANQQAGSILNSAFRFQGLNAWGEFYSDAVFDPFSGAAFIDESIRGSVTPFANSYQYGADVINNAPNGQLFSSTLQGLLLEPTLISSPTREFDILTRPFFEVSVGGGFTAAYGKTGKIGEAEVQGYTNLPNPTSYYANFQWQKAPDSRDAGVISDIETELEVLGGNVFLTTSPTYYDRIVLYYNDAKSTFDQEATIPVADPFFGLIPELRSNRVDGHSRNGGLGWSHTFAYENVMNAALLYSSTNRTDTQYSEIDLRPLLPILPAARISGGFEQDAYIAAISHSVKADELTWRYGVEGGWIDSSQTQTTENLLPPILGGGDVATASSSDRTGVARAYVDLLHEIQSNLKAEYALFGSYLNNDVENVARLEPRLGLAWSPAEGQWLRAAFIRSSIDLSTPTLSPVSVMGLQANEFDVQPGGRADTVAFRWDSEWSDAFFTAVELQHQDLHEAQIAVPLAAVPFSTREGRIDRASLTGNLFLGSGFGLSSTIAFADSKDKGDGLLTAGGPLPFVPEWAGQVALTYVNSANVRVSLAANYIGDRESSSGTSLDDYWSLDSKLTWEPLDKRLELELEAYNLLDEDFEVDAGVPGWGRSFRGTLKVRF